jgi:hypothetical protein
MRKILYFVLVIIITFLMYRFITITKDIPSTCRMSKWSIWSDCQDGLSNPVKCGGGYQIRKRKILQHSRTGELCPATEDTRPCNEQECDRDCIPTEWSNWSECDAECGTGTQLRTRHVRNLQTGKGLCNIPMTDSRICSHNICPKNCKVGSWTKWSKCLLPEANTEIKCGGGYKYRTRTVTSGIGRSCPINKQVIPCNTLQCPSKCEVSGWSDWSKCSESCGESGVQTRTRIVKKYPTGNYVCPILTDTKKCNRIPCHDDDCKITNWSKWSKCIDNDQSSTRTIVKLPINKKVCPPLIKYRPCDKEENQDCKIGPYFTSGCSKICGGGTKYKTATIIKYPVGTGKKCPPILISQKCNDNICPVDCKLGKYTPWTSCQDGKGNMLKCGDGVIKRNRNIVQQSQNGGIGCGSLSESKTCNLNPCPVDCHVNYMSPWYNCTSTCDRDGTEKRDWHITPSKFGGKNCNSPCQTGECQETRKCDAKKCKRNCEYSEWHSNEVCPPCGDHKTNIIQSRTILREGINGGQQCTESLTRSIPCNIPKQKCAENCVLGPWVSDGVKRCSVAYPSAKCRMLLTRKVISPAKYGGTCISSKDGLCKGSSCKYSYRDGMNNCSHVDGNPPHQYGVTPSVSDNQLCDRYYSNLSKIRFFE